MNELQSKYLLVGAGQASVWAALTIREHDSEGTVTIVGREPHPPYDHPPLSKGMLTDDSMVADDAYAKLDNFYADNRIRLIAGTQVTANDRIVTSLSAAGMTTFTHDTNGNLTVVQDPTGTTTMTYDKENRMTVHQSGGVYASYTYDGMSRKRSEIVGGTATTLVWDGWDYLQSRAASKINFYTVGGGILAQETVSGARWDYLTDALGSVIATQDSTSAVGNTYRYKPYGAQLAKSGTSADPAFGWVGNQGYRQTGRLYSEQYIRARHVGTTQARWTTRDPMWPYELAYGYVSAMPTVWVDPTGMQKHGPPFGFKDPPQPLRPPVTGPEPVPVVPGVGAGAGEGVGVGAGAGAGAACSACAIALGISACYGLCTYRVGDPHDICTWLGDSGGQVLFPNPGDYYPPLPRRYWTPKPHAVRPKKCTAKCPVNPLEPGNVCPDYVYGYGMGPTEEIACRTAKSNAMGNIPRGCHAKHCNYKVS